MFRKISALLLCALLAAGLAACGKKPEESGPADTPGTPADTPADGDAVEIPYDEIESLKPEAWDLALMVSVNPSFVLFVNAGRQDVISAHPLNDDARALLERIPAAGRRLDDALKDIVRTCADATRSTTGPRIPSRQSRHAVFAGRRGLSAGRFRRRNRSRSRLPGSYSSRRDVSR